MLNESKEKLQQADQERDRLENKVKEFRAKNNELI